MYKVIAIFILVIIYGILGSTLESYKIITNPHGGHIMVLD